MKMNIAVTTRLSFKLMDEHDWPQLYELDQDPAVMQHLSQGKPTTLEEIKTISIPRMLAYRNAQQGWGLWQVNLREGNIFIGWVLVRPMGLDMYDDGKEVAVDAWIKSKEAAGELTEKTKQKAREIAAEIEQAREEHKEG